MRREFSAGGVVVRRLRGDWSLAAIRPGGRPFGTWALPKGAIASGERPEDAALRETREETGLTAELVTKLGDTRYVYTWAGVRIFKVVSFYLLHSRRGRLGDITPEFRHEVAGARWLALGEAPALLAYRGEQEMAERAAAFLAADAL